MTKQEYLEHFVKTHVKSVLSVKKQNNKLLKNCGSQEKFKIDVKAIEADAWQLANKIAEKVDWTLLKSDEKAFRQQFVDVMLDLS